MSGLDDLAAQRQKATSRRTMPPPKTPARATPVELPQEAPVAEPGPEESKERKKQQGSGTSAAAAPAPAAAKSVSLAEAVTGDDLARYTIYLDAKLDDYLTDVINAGRRRRPRLSVSRSSVVRLALTELADRLDPAAAAAEIADRAHAPDGTGRPRL